MKKIVGWMIRGGDQTRAALARQDDLIADLQRKVDEFERLAGPAAALPDRVREAIDDLGDRVAAINLRVESVEQRLIDLDDAIDRLTTRPSTGD